MKKYAKGELAKTLLLAALAGGAIATIMVLPGLAILFKMVGADNTYERKRVKSALKRMEEQGIVTRRIKNGKEELVVTPAGKKTATSYLMDDLTIVRPKMWDQTWRLLMFDIPEKKRRVRDEVSFKVKDIGMHPIQNSVFVSPFPCKKQIDLIAGHYFVKKHFIYCEVSLIEGADNLLTHFNLR